jgi:hypothetical protein
MIQRENKSIKNEAKFHFNIDIFTILVQINKEA